MLYIKAGTFNYINLTVCMARMRIVIKMQCRRMVRALRSYGRCWLVSSDEMSPYTSRSRTSSVTDRRLITDLSTAPYDQKDLCVFCPTYTSVESLATKHGWTSQTAESVDNRFSPRYNRFIYFPQTSNSSATTTLCSFINTTSMCRLKFFHYSVESPYWLSSRDVII